MLAQPVKTTHHSFFNPPREDTGIDDEQLRSLSNEAAQREQAYVDSLNRNEWFKALPEPALREPQKPENFEQKLQELDEGIVARGIPVSRARLLSLGRKRFEELLEADHKAREEQRVVGVRTDFTSWSSVYQSFAASGALRNLPVPERKASEVYQGHEPERDQVRALNGFSDLWKFGRVEPRAVKAILDFLDRFESLRIGQQLFVDVEDDGTIRSHFLAGGKTASCFRDWLSVVDGPHFSVTLKNPVPAIAFWLSGERSELPDPLDWARNWTGMKAPHKDQILMARAVIDGFCLNHRGWLLWNFVGNRTRKVFDQATLETWRDQLQKQFPRITAFHAAVMECFYKPEGDHARFEPARHRRFLDQKIENLRGFVSGLIALEVRKICIARFRDSVLCSGSPPSDLQERIDQALKAAFPAGATFEVEVES